MYYKDIKNMEEEKDEDSYFTKVIKFYPKNKEE
jgi:hypothetical protein